MRSIKVYNNDVLAGVLQELSPTEYVFRYEDDYFCNPSMGSISLTLPKSQQEYRDSHIFPFFTNMLPEGGNRRLWCRKHRVDENDFFGMLMMVRGADFIGAINLK
jgi:HipA-like protein